MHTVGRGSGRGRAARRRSAATATSERHRAVARRGSAAAVVVHLSPLRFIRVLSTVTPALSLFVAALAARSLPLSSYLSPRGGLFLRWLGLAVVTSDGSEVSALLRDVPCRDRLTAGDHVRSAGFAPGMVFLNRWLYETDPINERITPFQWPVIWTPFIARGCVDGRQHLSRVPPCAWNSGLADRDVARSPMICNAADRR